MPKNCFDTGALSIYFGRNIPDRSKILSILKSIKQGENEVHVLSPVIAELFYHLCKIEGKAAARTKILSFKALFPIHTIELTEDILFRAAELKCQHRNILSYVDCFSLAYCLLKNIAFHTTEKKLRELPNFISERIQIIAYKWD
jgi:predicted nucleic acid-binding protein